MASFRFMPSHRWLIIDCKNEKGLMQANKNLGVDKQVCKQSSVELPRTPRPGSNFLLIHRSQGFLQTVTPIRPASLRREAVHLQQLQFWLHCCLVFIRLTSCVDVCDFTRPHCVGPPAEIRQLVVEDDACSRGVNGSSESTAQIRRRHYDLIEYRPIITDCLKGCPAHRWFMVLVAETASPSSSMTETCVVPMWSGPGTVL